MIHVRRGSRRFSVFTLVAALLFAAGAQAQDGGERTAARQLAQEGVEALRNGDLAAAVDKLGRADGLYEAPTVSYYYGQALEQSGRWTQALEEYLAATRLATPSGLSPELAEAHDQARTLAQEAYDSLLPRVPKLTIAIEGVEPDAVAATIDGEVLSPAALGVELPADPGEHLVVGRLGDQERTASVILTEGVRETVQLEFAPQTDVPRSPEPAEQPSAEPAGVPWQRTVGAVGIGVGAAGLLVGGITAATAAVEGSKLSDDCPNDSCPRERHDEVDNFQRLRVASTVGFVVGVLGVGAGVTLLATAPKERRVSLRIEGPSLHLKGKF